MINRRIATCPNVSAPSIYADTPGRPTGSPFAQFNLWRNPFGELTRQERAEQAVVEQTEWLSFLQTPRAVIQFLGPCGHGKSTHLLALQRELSGAIYIYLPEDGPQPTVPLERPLLLDEAQRIGWLQLKRLVRSSGPLVLGSHKDLTPSFRRTGWQIRSIDLSAGPGAERLAQILNRRIEASRCGPGTIPRVECKLAVILLEHIGSDVRAIERFLYEQFQRFARGESTWPPAI